MKRSITISVLLMFVGVDLLACPACAYNRAMPTWFFFMALRLFAVCIISFAVLDVVRTLQVFLVYEVLYLYLWPFALYYSFPFPKSSVSPELAAVANVYVLIVETGILAAILLKILGRFKWFRRDPKIGVSWARASLIIPATFLITIIESLITNP
jgi:hypothetical protein